MPPSFSDTLVASVENPTAMTFTPDGRILVTGQFGELRVIANDSLLPTPALDVSSSLCTADEQGLLGVERDPSFASNGFIYVYYTHARGSVCENRVSRFTMTGNVAGPSSELVLIDGIPSLGNHNAGDLHFGPDGYLYVSVGDAECDYLGNSGCGGNNDASRDQNVLLGKILRVTSTGGIPPSNPFQGANSARCNTTGRTSAGNTCQETFARGLRNPFRFTFDPNDPGGRFFINDVGQNDWEEVDLGTSGADYGWNVREGMCVNGQPTNCGAPPAGMTNPLFSYRHDGCDAAITGAAFVPNGIWPAALNGTYLYGDYVCGTIYMLTPGAGGTFTRSEFATGVGAVVNLAFGPAPVSQAPSGRALYYTNYDGGGQVRRIAYTAATNRSPTASLTTSAPYGAAPLTVNFDASTSSDPDAGDTLSYEWSFGDGATQTTATPTTSHAYTGSTNVTATLTVRDNHGASNSTAVVIYPGDTPPQPSIASPAAGTLFSVGQVLTLNGSATDAEQGTLGSSSLSWEVLRHHATHTHPFLAPTTGNGITITGPDPEDLLAATNSYLEIRLTATDARGLTTLVTRDVQPRKVDVTLATSPTGLQVSVNGQAYTAPQTFTSWAGYGLALAAQNQANGGQTWNFTSWSDGGAASHSYVTPSSASTVTATFTQSASGAGLVGAWGFSEGSGSAVADSSGSGNNGTLSGTAWTAAGKFGSALTFNGSNSWVTVPDAASLDVTRMTVEAWVRPTSLGNWRTVLLKERPGGIAYSLYASQGSGRPLGQVDIGGQKNATGTAALPVNTWTHLAATYDGTTERLYVNGTPSGTASVTGSIPASTGALRMGGNSIWGEWFTGSLDEVRVYNRALSQAEIQTDMNTAVGGGAPPPDTQPPTAPASLAATTSAGSVDLAWQASSDNVGVVRYDVFRSTTSGFTPATANRIAQVTTTSYHDTSPPPATYFYKVIAVDAAGNSSASSNEAAVAVTAPDTQAPTAPGSLTATVNSGSVDLAWTASTDNVGVVGYDVFRSTTSGFTPATANRIAQVTGTTYRDPTPAAGTYYYKVIAADAAGNSSAASSQATATISAAPVGLVGAWAFSEASGSAVSDSSGAGNAGTISGAVRTAAGKFGSALTFNGSNSWVTVPDAASLDVTRMTLEAWVRPTALGTWRTVLLKERPGGIAYSLYASQGSSLPVGQVDIGGQKNAQGSAATPLNAWTHLAVTYDGTTERLYVNGVQAASTAFTGSIPASTGALRIGGNSIWGEWFTGSLDELRVYNRALSQAEIQADMNRPI